MLSPGNTHNKRANAMHQAATPICIDNCEPVRETPCATWAGAATRGRRGRAVASPGFAVVDSDDAVVAVRWQGREETVFYQDGPYLLRAAKDPGFKPIATYANGDLAAARYSFGRGVVVLSGPHPEADAPWFEAAGIGLEHKPDARLLRSLLVELER